MAASDSPLPSTLWAMPGPLILVAAVALLTLFGVQRTANEAGTGKAAPSPLAATRANDTDAPTRSPAMELLRRYLNEVRDEESSTGPDFEFSSRLSIRDRSLVELSGRVSHRPESPASAALPEETSGEKRLRALREELGKLRGAHPFELRCLVATVPDPIDSHLQLMFDAAFAAMTRACEQHGYVLDRHELPWARELRERPVTGRPDIRKYRHPGAVLFRKLREHVEPAEGETCDLLMLLLVGETPTGGVRKNSLGAALDFVAACEQTSPAAHQLSIRLLGPSFSGSSPSLRWAIFDWKKNRHLSCYTDLEVDIVSGSATAKRNCEILTARADPAGRGEKGWPPLRMQFHTTIIPDEVTEVRLMEHLVNTRSIPRDRIALLVEGNTGYGQSLTGDTMGRQPDGKGAQTAGFEGILVLPFPMALSRIRSEYEQSRAERVELAGELPRAARRNLKLPLDPPPYATDVLPTFADGAAAVTDLSLEQILATISRRGIRAVGIVGTDIRDKLFLAQQVRRNAPNVQLFMLESDLLYTHADYAPSLSGTLIASTYPLFTPNQRWTGGGLKALLFPADTAEGVYNAAILLLNRLDTTSAPQPLIDYAYPFARSRKLRNAPPLWLSIAGESRLWPVQAYRLSPAERDGVLASGDGKTLPRKARPIPDPPSYLPTVVASIVSLAFLLIFWAVNRRPASRGEQVNEPVAAWSQRLGRIRASCRWLALPAASTACGGNHDSGTREAVGSHLLIVACFFLALFVQQLLLSSPIIAFVLVTFASSSGIALWWEWLLSLLALALGAALLWVVLRLTFRVLWGVLGFAPPSAAGAWRCFTKTTWYTIVAGLVIFVGFVWGTSPDMPPETQTQIAIFIERVGTLSSGVTWLVPAVLLAVIVGCWAACQLWRRHFLGIYRLANPVSPRESAATSSPPPGQTEDMHTAGFKERFRELEGRLKSTWFVPTESVDWLFLVLLGFGIIYVFGVRWIGTAEGWIFDGIFRGAAGIAVLLIGWSLIHVKSVGGLFERLLRRTAQHAMVSAFDRVPDRLAAKTAGQIFAASPHPGDLEQPVRCLMQLAEEAPELWWDAPQDAGKPQVQLAELLNCSRNHKDDVDRRAAELNGLLADIASERIVPRLVPYWDRKATVREAKEDKHAAAAQPAGWEERAEVFLAMHFVNLIRQVFAHLKSELTFLVVMLFSLLAAFHAYPFQPGRLIMQLAYGLTFWCLVTTVLLIIRFNRCEVLSRLSKTAPNRFTFDRTLVLPLLTFVVIPLISLLAVQFPGIGRMLFGWLETCRDSLPS